MLNQLGGSVGVAIVALIVESASTPLAGLHGVYWFLTGAIVVLLAESTLLPGRPTPGTAGLPAEAEQGGAR